MIAPKLSYNGCCTSATGLLGSNWRRSCITFSLMVIKASQVFKKYLVNALSPGLCSCGITLSAMQTIFVCRFFLTLLKIVPSAGPINGNQNLTTIISGFLYRNQFPTLIQLIGLTEMIAEWITRFSGGGSSLNCV